MATRQPLGLPAPAAERLGSRLASPAGLPVPVALEAGLLPVPVLGAHVAEPRVFAFAHVVAVGTVIRPVALALLAIAKIDHGNDEDDHDPDHEDVPTTPPSACSSKLGERRGRRPRPRRRYRLPSGTRAAIRSRSTWSPAHSPPCSRPHWGSTAGAPRPRCNAGPPHPRRGSDRRRSDVPLSMSMSSGREYGPGAGGAS